MSSGTVVTEPGESSLVAERVETSSMDEILGTSQKNDCMRRKPEMNTTDEADDDIGK